jgi:hypothetical protein
MAAHTHASRVVDHGNGDAGVSVSYDGGQE